MRREDTYAFLVRAAIPRVTDKDKLPYTQDNEPKVKGYKRIWDAIYRAHRDVLTGRSYVSDYSGSREDFNGEAKAGVNLVARSLYEYFLEQIDQGKSLTSRDGMQHLETFRNQGVSLGCIQKLVNMSLKYLLILQFNGEIDRCVDPVDCDCPIDSVILSKLNKERGEIGGVKTSLIRWTRLDDRNLYDAIERAIEEVQGSSERIMYDFVNWQ